MVGADVLHDLGPFETVPMHRLLEPGERLVARGVAELGELPLDRRIGERRLDGDVELHGDGGVEPLGAEDADGNRSCGEWVARSPHVRSVAQARRRRASGGRPDFH